MKALWLVGAFAVGLVIGYFAAVQVWDKRAKRWIGERDSLVLAIDVKDAELAVMDAEATRHREVVNAPDTVTLPARRPVPISSTDVPDVHTNRPVSTHVPAVASETSVFDSLTHYKSLTDTLLQEQAELHNRIGRDAVKLAAYASLVAIRDTQLAVVTSQRDSLRSLASRVPLGKPRGINLLGLRLCPVVGVGYALLGTGQHGPALTVTQPLSCD